MKAIRYNDNAWGLLLAASAFCVYLRTLSGTVTTEDPGELATALYTLGIAHPTGYPLFTLLGWFFSHLPIGGTVIWRLNLLGALLAAFAAFWFFRLFLFLLSPRARALFGMAPPPAANPTVPRAAAAAGAVVFAYSAVYWSEAVALEVYALHLVFLALVTGLFLRALADGTRKAWILFAFTLGLSFTNHMMTVLLAPAFLYLFFSVHGFGRAAWGRIAVAVLPFLAPLSLYLYLPLRAAQGPLMNWGDPSTPGAVWKHVTAAQYGDQMFSSWEIAGRKFAGFFRELPGDFGYAPLVLAVLGLWSLRRAPRLLVFTALIFATGVFYAVNYAFNDPNFNLNAHFVVATWVVLGARWIVDLPAGARPRRVALLVVGVIALCPLFLNFSRLDKSRDTLVDDYARNVLNSMDSGAVFFTNEYERLGGPAFYLQNVEGFRKDVAVLDIILLGNPWYFGHLEQSAPWLLEESRAEVEVFRAKMDRFLESQADSAGIRASVAVMFHAFVRASWRAGRPVYVSGGINPDLIEPYQHAPTGMVFRLLGAEDTTRVAVREPVYRPLPASNPLSPTVLWDYAQSYAYQGAYRLWLGDTAGGRRLLRKAVELKPDFHQAREMLENPR
jgi:hypothetical protein